MDIEDELSPPSMHSYNIKNNIKTENDPSIAK
jgi:hypothetical protein